MNATRPLAKIRKLRGGARLADLLTRLADARNSSAPAVVVRRAGGFPRRPIPMYWFNRLPNFGDILSCVIVECVSHGTPILVPGRYRGKLLAGGSILGYLAEDDVVWGAGAIRDEPITPPPGVTFHAVRGPLTRGLIRGNVPEVYGDPAMLLPRFYTPRAEKRFELGVIPHYVDRDAVHVTDPSVFMVDALSDWRDVVEGIAQCRAILSSSLHGLVLAEAYGIPAVWMMVTDKVIGGGFKFRDYYLSTGREPPEPIPWERALREVGRHLMEPPRLETEALLRAWPEDLTFPPDPGERD